MNTNRLHDTIHWNEIFLVGSETSLLRASCTGRNTREVDAQALQSTHDKEPEDELQKELAWPRRGLARPPLRLEREEA